MFSKIMGQSTSANNAKFKKILRASFTYTPLGPMLIISDDKMLYLLGFAESYR